MIYRRFGATELRMPVFSCGGMRYQAKWTDIKPEEVPQDGQKNLEATIRHAVDIGVNHIETARGYGSSEMQLGYVLPTFPRDKIIVQTKVAPSADPKQFLDTFDLSMKQLRLDHVDLLGLHGVNNRETLEWSVRPGGCLEAARKLQKQGRVRHVGFSTHGPVDVILDAIRHRDNDTGRGFDYVNLHWYYIFQRNWPAVEEATKRDMGVFIISPSDKGGKLYAPPQKLRDLTAPLSPIVFNDLFCLARPQVHTLSVGAACPGDFDEHLKTLPLMEQARQTLSPIERKLAEAMRQATGLFHPEEMSRGMPDPDKTPGEINLEIILWLRNLVVGWDMLDYAKMRYNLLGNGGHWFPGLNAGKLDEVGEQAIRKVVAHSPYADRVIALLREAHDLMGGEAVKRLSRSS